MPGRRQWLWFVSLWLAGAATVAVLGYGIRWWLGG